MSQKRWYAVWTAWIVTAVVGDTIAYVLYGKRCTLSVFVRKSFYLEPQSQWSRLGQFFIAAFFMWLSAHLCFDMLQPLPNRFDGDVWRRRDSTQADRARAS